MTYISNKDLVFIDSMKDGTSGDNGEILDGHKNHKEYLTCIKMVLLLADVFEKFIETSWKFYKPDPCHYFSSPWLSWDAMLKMTNVELEKIQTLTCIYSLKKN